MNPDDVRTPVPARLSAADAWHLLTRTGFAPSPGQLSAWTGQPTAAAVDRLLREAAAARPVQQAPDFTREAIRSPYNRMDEDERKEARKQARRDTIALSSWWFKQMRDTPAPLAERMTLFWHGRFATSMQKVQQEQGMYLQHQLLRRHALGSFRELAQGVARDPAMLIYLDGASNRVKAPNENFAREVMELFILGEGQYSERDIREAARAFSGWTVDRSMWQAEFKPARHDDSPKTLFGRSANYDMGDAIDQMMAQPAASRFIVGKLWREFVSPKPDAEEVDRIAKRLRASNWRIEVALRELFLSKDFWAASSRGALIKSPVELIVGTLRQFEVPVDNAEPLARLSAKLEQSLFYPPNVKGWPGYTEWIDSTTLLERKRFTERLFRAVETGPMRGEGMSATRGMRFDAEAWLRQFGAYVDREPDAALQGRIEAAVLAVPLVNPVPDGTVGIALLRAIGLDPAFQLK
jgi:uncharacterized protein (DUF1800 family)